MEVSEADGLGEAYRITYGDGATLVVPESKRHEIAALTATHYENDCTERMRYQQEIAANVLKGLYLLNGGAVVGLLTFLGNNLGAINRLALVAGFASFILGLVTNTLAQLKGFEAQGNFMRGSYERVVDAQRFMCFNEPANGHITPESEGTKALSWGTRWAWTSLALFSLGAISALFGLLPALG